MVFLMLRLSPGDPAAVIAGDYASPEDIAKIRTQLGLDQPIIVQFSTWVWSLMQGNLGISIFSNLPVTKLIAQRLEPTLMLSLTTLIFAVVVACQRLGASQKWIQGSCGGCCRGRERSRGAQDDCVWGFLGQPLPAPPRQGLRPLPATDHAVDLRNPQRES